MTRNRAHDDDDESTRNTFKSCENSGSAPWSDINHDVLFIVMMRLGVIDFVSFSGVCKSWRSFALCNRKKFMASKPPMLVWFPDHDPYTEMCYLEDFEGRRFKTLLPDINGGRTCVELTCGYLILFGSKTRDFLLVNPITRHQLHFPDFPSYANVDNTKAILVSSPSMPRWVLVVMNRFDDKIWFSIAGKGEWNQVSYIDGFVDIQVFKGKIYTLNDGGRFYEMSLNQNPTLTLLEIENYRKQHIFHQKFVSCGENLYVIDDYQHRHILYKLNFGEMKRVLPKVGECAFFLRWLNHGVAIKPESWAVDPRSGYKRYDCFHDTDDETRKGRFFRADLWYFPHLCLDVDLINE